MTRHFKILHVSKMVRVSLTMLVWLVMVNTSLAQETEPGKFTLQQPISKGQVAGFNYALPEQNNPQNGPVIYFTEDIDSDTFGSYQLDWQNNNLSLSVQFSGMSREANTLFVNMFSGITLNYLHGRIQSSFAIVNPITADWQLPEYDDTTNLFDVLEPVSTVSVSPRMPLMFSLGISWAINQ